MTKTYSTRLRHYLKWVFWFLVIQIILANISAAIYAYKFTHFYDPPAPTVASSNIFAKTWRLFVGPTFYKVQNEEKPLFPVESVKLTTSDGLTLDAWYGSQDSAAQCVIFFHGYMVNKSFMNNEAAMFRRWGYNVLMVDFRAHGLSEGRLSSFGLSEIYDVQSAFQYAKNKGNSKIILYGASLGAGICLRAAAENQVQPDAIIADMPYGSLHNHFKARARNLRFPSEPFASLVTFWIGLERGYKGFSRNVSSYATRVSCPVLVEWGEKDEFVNEDEVDEIYTSLKSANKKMVKYSQAGHESLLVCDPVKWSREVGEFVAKGK